ncbi:MAG: ECF transporter S component [Oscillospiraceae bacterium]|nr:ECF transporter S component [Oscillospiraceae bacterium]
MSKQKMSVRYIAMVAMFCAISYIAMLLGDFVPKIAGFLSYDPKDAIVVIAGFILGPMASFFISLIVSFIEMITVSTTGPYGFLMNVISTCAFAIPAAVVYRKRHTHNGAVLGLAIGTVVMVICMVIWNYIVTPFYMGVPREQVAAMLVPVFLPFNLVKGGINAGLTLLIYAPIVSALRKAKLVEPSQSGGKKKFNAGYTLFALMVLVTFVLLFLVIAGVL